MSKTTIALTLVLTSALTACAGAPPPAPAGRAGTTAPTAVLALKPYIANLRTIEVKVGGESQPFLLDTGGGFTILTPQLAQRVGCQAFGRLTGFRHSGERLDTERCGPVDLEIGGQRIATEAAIFDLMSLLQGAPEVGGIVALQTFEPLPFTLDLAKNQLLLETPASLAARVRGATELRVRPSRQSGGASLDLFVAVRTPRGDIWLELDSGNVGPVILSPHAWRQLGNAPPAAGSQEIDLDFHGLGKVAVEAVARDTIYDGLLDATFCEHHVLSFDLAALRAWARPNG